MVIPFKCNKPHTGICTAKIIVCMVGCLLLLPCLSATAQRRGSRGARQIRPQTVQDFDALAAQASQAREANRIEEAIPLYRKALSVRPKWAEGWWYLATLLYDRDAYADATGAFQRAANLQPKAGAAWGMLGLCEFRIGRYDEALEHLSKARHLGLPADNPELSRVVRYHEALVLLLKGDFETAQATFGSLCYEGLNSKELILALGLSVLQIPSLPGKSDLSVLDLVTRAGQVAYLDATKNLVEAKREYQRLMTDYPTTHNIAYAYGRFLLTQRDDDGAIEAFRREIEITPDSKLARLQIANIKLRNKQPAAGLPFAEEVLKLYPNDPLAQYIQGRLLLDLGKIELAIKSLEIARNFYPDEPKIYYQLGRAYARANRRDDADKALETFARLRKLAVESSKGPARSVESLKDDTSEAPSPTPPLK
jgi:tetratricopeptide (TPR) repeat protein